MSNLDRRITVRRTVSTFNIYGRPEETSTDFSVWARRIDRSFSDRPDDGGQPSRALRVYRVRWRKDFIEWMDDAETPPAHRPVLPSMLIVLDADLFPDDDGTNVLSVDDVKTAAERGPLRERRRFIDLEVLGEAL